MTETTKEGMTENTNEATNENTSEKTNQATTAATAPGLEAKSPEPGSSAYIQIWTDSFSQVIAQITGGPVPCRVSPEAPAEAAAVAKLQRRLRQRNQPPRNQLRWNQLRWNQRRKLQGNRQRPTISGS